MLGMTFSPLVFDSFGSLGPHSLKTLQKIIAKAVGDNSPQPIQEATYYWQRISLAFARAVCRQLVLSLN